LKTGVKRGGNNEKESYLRAETSNPRFRKGEKNSRQAKQDSTTSGGGEDLAVEKIEEKSLGT